MAYRLKMARAHSIHTLYQRGWSRGRIVREVGINRETGARHLKDLQPAPKPAIAPLGSREDQLGSKPAHVPLGSSTLEGDPKPAHAPLGCEPDPTTSQTTSGESGRLSECEPWRDQILEKLQLGLSA